MPVTENQIMDSLKTVIDPEIGINIIDLGLIYNLEYNEKEITITMTLTTPGCPMHNSITNWVKETLLRLAPDAEIKVNLVWQPPWSPQNMSDEAKRQLGYIK